MDTISDLRSDDLRARMVDQLCAAGTVRSTRVEAALRAVPRHAFLPAVSVQEAYADRSVTTKAGLEGGRPLSCASQPTIVAMMLEQLGVRPGDRVLEVGAGTGYNAALLAELVGQAGEVTTVDVYPDVTDRARRALAAAGYGRVRVVTGDGALGVPERAPYDRVIVTVGPWDIPPAWVGQLASGGRLVVPLAWRGQARSLALVREGEGRGGGLGAVSVELCGFIPMVGQDGERSGPVDPDGHVTLTWDADQPIDPAALAPALARPGATVWPGVTVAPDEPFDGIWLRLTATEAGTCRIVADQVAVDTGLCRPVIPALSPAIVDGDSLAYLTARRVDTAPGVPGERAESRAQEARPPSEWGSASEPSAVSSAAAGSVSSADDAGKRRWELGAVGHGPVGDHLAQRLGDQVVAWDGDRHATPSITIRPRRRPPTGPAERQPPAGPVIDKAHIQLVISY